MRATVLIPFLNGGRDDWLAQCTSSLPAGTPYLVCRNDGEMADALNAGLAQVKTDLVFVVGADDIVQPKALDLLGSLIWNADVTYPSMILTNTDLDPEGYFPAEPFDGNRLLQWNFVPGVFLARTDMLRKVGGWRQLEALEDWDLHVRMFRAGARFKPVPEAEILYRQTPGSRNKPEGGFDKQEWRQRIVGETRPVEATFYYQATPATTYWRCQLPARYLPGRCLPDLEVHLTPDDATLPDHEGTAVFQFPGDKHKAALATVVLPSLGVRTLVETDDNYLVANRNRKRQGWNVRIGQGAHTLQGHRAIVEKVDGVIVTTEALASAYRKVNPNVWVCPNSIDPADWPEIEKPQDGVFRIGWYASLSHADDAKLVRRALEWCSRQPDVEVVTMGFDPGWRFRRRHIPWSNDLAVYWKAMQILDVGLCPVIPNPWSVCRSDLKALEYSMGGAVPVMSAQPPYDQWDDGLKAGTAKEFLRLLQHFVSHRDEARSLAAEAKRYVLSERTVQANIHKWRAAVRG